MTKKFTKKEVQLVSSLAKKGWSQKKIAIKLHTRKLNVTQLMQKRGIGKRAVQPFWEDVKKIRELKGKSWKKATTEVKWSKKWFERRQKRLTGIAKQRDAYGEKWQRIKEGEIGEDWWQTEEGEELMEAAEYD